MTWSFNTGNRYHTQDESYYCGAAAAMMILHEIGVPYSDLDQDNLYASNHNNNRQSGWATDPYGLLYTLNDRRPASFLPHYFVVYKPTNEAEGTRDVVWTLYHYRVALATLVYHCQHWIVVRGVQTDVEPSGGSYTVEGLWINNPVWWSSPPPPPHDDSDTCGSGGAHGVDNVFVTYHEWQTDYFTGCAYDAPSGNAQWISVCDPEPRTISLPRRLTIEQLADGNTIIEAKKLIDFTAKGLSTYHLAENEFVAPRLRGGGWSEPVLVTRLDRPGEFYYLQPWETDQGITGIAKVDARFGTFNGFQALAGPNPALLIGRERRDRLERRIASRIDGLKIDLPGLKGKLTMFKDAYATSPTLVWKPCRESWSPYLPFHQLTIGSETLYTRIDGPVFTELTGGSGG